MEGLHHAIGARRQAILVTPVRLCEDAPGRALPSRFSSRLLEVGDAVSLELKSDARHLGVVRAMVRSFGSLAGLDETIVHRVMLAVDEGCANVIRHAYGGNCEGDLQVTCAIEGSRDEGRILLIRLRDSGKTPDPARVSCPELGDPLVPGGLGLHLMRDAMDEVTFRREDGSNVLEMRLRCPVPPPPTPRRRRPPKA
jgi:anti-sigma regulatory factor (Ser/Thr protein kinase)